MLLPESVGQRSIDNEQSCGWMDVGRWYSCLMTFSPLPAFRYTPVVRQASRPGNGGLEEATSMNTSNAESEH